MCDDFEEVTGCDSDIGEDDDLCMVVTTGDDDTISVDLNDVLDTINHDLITNGGNPIIMDELIDIISNHCEDRGVPVSMTDEDGETTPLNASAEEEMDEEIEYLQQQTQIQELSSMGNCGCSTCHTTCIPLITAPQPVAVVVPDIPQDEEDTEEDIDLRGVPYYNSFEAQDAEASTTLDMEIDDES